MGECSCVYSVKSLLMYGATRCRAVRWCKCKRVGPPLPKERWGSVGVCTQVVNKKKI